MSSKPFNSVVAARTRAASFILGSSELLTRYLELGGLKEDLERIEQAGSTAEIFNQAQGLALADGKTATLGVLRAFAFLQGEYSLVMGIVRAIRGELVATKGAPGVIKKVDSILVNEAEVRFGLAEGGPRKKASKKVSQEAIRAEIARDAQSLLTFTELAPRLDARRCPRLRLEKLKTDAQALAGKLAERAASKGAQKISTQQEREAVAAQTANWSSTYRLLFALGQLDPRVKTILSEAAGSPRR